MKRLLFLIAVVLVGCGSTTRTLAPESTHTGKLTQVIYDTRPNATEPYQLKYGHRPSEYYELRFHRPVSIPELGSSATIKGRLEGKTIREAKFVSSTPPPTSTKRTVSGTKNIAWIAYGWAAKPAPWTNAELKERTLTGEISVAKFYEAMSFGKLKITGTVYGPYTTTKPCEEGKNEAVVKAEAEGYKSPEVSSTFQNVQYVLPPCEQSGGHAETFGVQSTVNPASMKPAHRENEPVGLPPVGEMGHELGHNFGLKHAHGIYCKNSEGVGIIYTVAETGCKFEQYGNNLDMMGGEVTTINAVEKMREGWWEASQIKTVTTSGNYTVLPAETSAAGVHLLAIKRGTPGDKEYYYVEFEQPLEPFWNYDLWYTKEFPFYKGALVQLAPAPGETLKTSVPEGPDLLMMEPAPPEPIAKTFGSQDWFTYANALREGKTYEDTESHLKLKVESSSAAGVVVKVSFQGGAPEPPTFTGAKYLSEKQAGVEWERSPEATKYEVFRRPYGTTEFTKVAETTTALHVVDTVTPAGNNIWQYCVKAVNTAGKSECSSIATTFLQTSSTGALAGWVETSGAGVVGAKISATFSGLTLTTWTGYRGYYRLELPGSKTWKVVVSKTGYANKETEAAIVTNKATVYSPIFTIGVGINTHANRISAPITDADVTHEFEEMKTLGVNNIRVPVSWSGIENSKGAQRTLAYCEEVAHKSNGDCKNLLRLNLIVTEAAKDGITVDGTITDTPPWAASPSHTYEQCEVGKLECYSFAPTTAALADVKSFTKYITTLFGSKMPEVAALNEPQVVANGETGALEYRKTDGTAFANPTVGTELALKYTEEANAIYSGAKEGNPAIKVFGGESDNKNHFIENILADNILMDGLGLHAYAEGGKAKGTCPGESNTTECKVKATELLYSGPIWVNEWGYTNQTAEPARAEHTKEGAELLHHSANHVEGFAYYQLRDQGTGSGAEENFGLLTEAFVQKAPFAKFKEGIK